MILLGKGNYTYFVLPFENRSMFFSSSEKMVLKSFDHLVTSYKALYNCNKIINLIKLDHSIEDEQPSGYNSRNSIVKQRNQHVKYQGFIM